MLAAAGGDGVVYRTGGLRSAIFWLAAICGLWRLALIGKVQQLYLVCSRSNGGFLRDLPAYLLVLFGCRVVVHTHGSDIVNLCQRPWIGGLARFFLSRCLLVLPSVHLESPLRDLGMTRIACCENFYEPSTEQLTEPQSEDTEISQDISVLWNSNIMASKGFFIVAEAISKLVRSGHRVSMTVLGRCIGDEIMDVDKCASEFAVLRQEPWLSYVGQVSRKESMQLLSKADIVCLPSTYGSECQPLAIIEAMCAARSIIIANTSALSATVGSYPCFKVDVPVRPEVLANTMLRCINESRGRELSEAAAAARERFSPERFDQEMGALLGVYQSCTGEKK